MSPMPTQFLQNFIWILHNFTFCSAELDGSGDSRDNSNALSSSEMSNILTIFSKLLKIFVNLKDPVHEPYLHDMARSLRTIANVSKYVVASTGMDRVNPDEIILLQMLKLL